MTGDNSLSPTKGRAPLLRRLVPLLWVCLISKGPDERVHARVETMLSSFQMNEAETSRRRAVEMIEMKCKEKKDEQNKG